MKYNKSEVLKWSLYVIAVSVFMELYVIFVSVVVNNNTLQEVRSVLIATPLLFGPSLARGFLRPPLTPPRSRKLPGTSITLNNTFFQVS